MAVSTPYFSAHTFDERRQRGENTNWYFDQFCGRCLTHNPQCPSPLHGLELTVRTDLCYLFGFSYWTNSFFFLALFIPYPVWKKCECRKIINPNNHKKRHRRWKNIKICVDRKHIDYYDFMSKQQDYEP